MAISSRYGSGSCRNLPRWLLQIFFIRIVSIILEPADCLSSSGPSSSSSTRKVTSFHELIWADQGVVSLVSFNDSSEGDKVTFVAGTKRGQLHLFERQTSGICDGAMLKHKGELKVEFNDDNHLAKSTVPYPFYSLLHHQDPTTKKNHLFVGSGDRFISVLQEDISTDNDDTGSSSHHWHRRQRLGPHTGWVKSLALDNTSSDQASLLHSIGCNCIETWELSSLLSEKDGETSKKWRHKKKRAIESSPKQGSTLSSDLLVLSVMPTIHNKCLVSGGVDGRLHIWSSDPDVSSKPLQSLAAHDGRVSALENVLLFHQQDACLLFSAGRDGVLQCRKISFTEIIGKKGESSENKRFNIDDALLGSVAIVDEDGLSSSLTAMACRRKDDETVEVLLGSSKGGLHQLHVSTNTNWETCSIKNLGTEVNVGPVSIINAISFISQDESLSTLSVVGHSKGLSCVAWTEEA